MKHRNLLVGTFALVGTSVFIGRFAAVAQPGEGGGAAGMGPDVIVGSLSGISKYGTVGGLSAYALGTTSCNIGDEYLLWCDTNVPGLCDDDDHPVIAQNLYRLKDGRIEQIGMSWLKHGFCALSQTLCGPCNQDDPYGCNALGIGCSDPYDSGLNGSQGNLGPRSQVNASTGIFPYPFSAPAAPATIGRRLQVPLAALVPADNAGALYFGEGHYVQWQDSGAGNDNNNASYRRVTVGSLTSGSYTLSFTSSTFQQKPAIAAWKDHGLGVNVPDPDVNLVNVDVEGDGRFIVGYKVSENEDGTWHYEYAVLNLNSDRGGQSWFVPVPDGVNVTNMGETILNHHSGEPYATTAWTADENAGGGCKWSSETFAENVNANALRWGTMFNYRFDADQPPVAGEATLALFKAGAALDPVVSVLVPQAPPKPECATDLNEDGVTDGGDLGFLLGNWGLPGIGDVNGDGIVNGADAGLLLAAWGECPV